MGAWSAEGASIDIRNSRPLSVICHSLVSLSTSAGEDVQTGRACGQSLILCDQSARYRSGPRHTA